MEENLSETMQNGFLFLMITAAISVFIGYVGFGGLVSQRLSADKEVISNAT